MTKKMPKWVVSTMMMLASLACVVCTASFTERRETPPAEAASEGPTEALLETAIEEAPVIAPAVKKTAHLTERIAIPEIPIEPDPEPDEEPAKTYIYFDVPLDDEMQEYIQDTCDGYDFDRYDIIVAMIQTESNFTEKIVSKTNDWGYMQLNICCHKYLSDKLGITDFLDGKQNVHAGIYLIQDLFHRYGDINKALMAYNLGEGGAAEMWKQGVYSTQYSKIITERARELVLREEV